MKGFQHTRQNRSFFHSLLRLVNLFFCCIHTFGYNRLSWTTCILLFWISTIIINHTICIFLLRVNIAYDNWPLSLLNHLGMFDHDYMENIYLDNFVNGKKMNKRLKKSLCPKRLTIGIICYKVINNRHYLSSFYCCHIFPIRHHIIVIGTLIVPKIWFLSHINRRCNLIDPVSKRTIMTRTKIDNNKGIFPYFGRNFWDDCGHDHDELPLVDLAMHLPPRHLQDITCQKCVLICLEFILCLIEIAFPRPLLPNLDPLLYKNSKFRVKHKVSRNFGHEAAKFIQLSHAQRAFSINSMCISNFLECYVS